MKVLRLFTFLSLSIILFSSCGLIWQKQKEEFTEKLFKEYPTIKGDVPYDTEILTHHREDLNRVVTDTLLIVTNGDKYFRIDKDGNRTEVELISVPRY